MKVGSRGPFQAGLREGAGDRLPAPAEISHHLRVSLGSSGSTWAPHGPHLNDTMSPISARSTGKLHQRVSYTSAQTFPTVRNLGTVSVVVAPCLIGLMKACAHVLLDRAASPFAEPHFQSNLGIFKNLKTPPQALYWNARAVFSSFPKCSLYSPEMRSLGQHTS